MHKDCPGGGFLLPSSRIPRGMVLDETDACIMSMTSDFIYDRLL